MSTVLGDLNLAETEAYALSAGLPKYRGKQIYRNVVGGRPIAEMSDLPFAVRANLEKDFARPPEIIEQYPSKDGSVKLLYRLYDGNLVEGVYMPHDYGVSLCVSTQVGCRMGCAFCASGIDGVERNLTAGEVLGEIIAANRLFRPYTVSHVVLMGSGEPLDNYENVVRFLRLATDADGLRLSRRNISLSTCGLAEKIRELADTGLDVTLSISLHATTDEVRRGLMPIAQKYTIAEIVAAARYYFERTGRRIVYEYAMIRNKNINFLDAKRLRELTKGYPAHVNLIMLNPVKEKPLEACTPREGEVFLKRLQDLGVSATIRKSMGNDVAGACGQLRRSKISTKS